MTIPPAVDEKRSTRRTSWLIGFSTLGSVIAGVLALIAALFAFVSAEWEAAGVCLVAAGVAFGALANALLRE
ncbi:MAG TPA: hypothetical protein VGM67_16385 [Gemmatimonadaceae bacterium]|jgi:VIT1/CCC1 family predicted Fe2+/Mn2+ transporter